MSEIITSSIEISAGIVSSGLTVDAGGEVTVLSGGTVTDAEAINYGYFWVEEGGYIGNIRVTNSGDAMVNGGLAENLTMESGGMADIFGGTMRTGTILNGGYGAVYEGGSGLDVAVSSGGRYLVNGGYAENTVVSSGGSFTVQLGSGLADKTTIEAGGHARIVSGGQMWETILNGGHVDVISGRILATTLNAGELHVSSGGPESGSGCAETTVVNAGSFIVSGATATDTTLNGGEFIVSGGLAQKTTVNGGDFIASDATVQSTTVSGGEFIASDAEVQSTTVSGGAVQFIGGTADKTDLFSGTVLVSGGTVQNTTLGSSTGGSINIPIVGPTFTPFDPHNPIILNPINWDDIILVDDGGTATITYGTGGSILLDGGATVYTPEQRETIGYAGYPGQTVNGDEASAGEEEPACRLDILNGGLAVSTTVNSGLMQVFEGGAANKTTVKGGTLHISGGGIANNITMSGGGGGRYSIIVGGDTNTYGDAISFNPVPSGSGTPFVTVFEGGTANNITVSGGLLTLSGGTANDVTLAGGTFHVSSGGIANTMTMTGGTATVFNGGRISGATVTGGTVRFLEGGTLAGPFTVTASADVYMESGSVIAFDITNMTPGAEAESSGLSYIWGDPSYTLTVSDIQAAGVYALSAEAAGFRDAITVQNQFGVQLGTLTVGNTVFLNNQYYTLRVTDNVLNLTVSNEAPARMWDPVMVFVNDAWASLPEGSTVEPVAGISATIGVDAFATGRDATNAVAGDGTVVVVGGEASFQYGITRDTAAWNGASVTGSTVLRNGVLTLYAGSTGNDLTVTRDGKLFVNAGATGNTLNVTSGGDLAVSGVARGIRVQNGGMLTVKAGGVCSGTDISGTLVVEAGGYLTGTGKFASGVSITVNGIINFDLTCLSAGNSALFTGNGTSIAGAPSFTIMVSDSQATGTYSLANRLSGLDGLFTILNVRGEAIGTLTVGSGILLDGRAYMLRRDGTGISLTISEAGDTNVLYVNTDWMELEPGALVGTPSGMAIIGYDAFGDLHTAEERLPEDGFIIITGGTYASETISIGITMEGGTISGSAITATGSLTMNNSSGAANLTVDGALVMNSRAKASDLTVNGRLVMNDSSEAENITVTGSIMLNGNSKATNLTAKGMAVVRGADNARLDGTITIGSGATLTGSLKFGEVSDLVIDGTWVFDISGSTTGNEALFRAEGTSVTFSGTTTQLVITVSDTQDFGVYKLASGITGFDDAFFTIVNTTGTTVATLAAGESITVNGKYYRLSCAADNGPLALTVANEPNAYRTYVNSVWRDKSFGDLVQTPDGAVVFGVNAFADLDTAQLSTSEYGTVFVVGGTFDSGSITRNVQVSDTSVANLTVSGYGTLTLNSGATARDITVSAGSLLTVNAGATLTITSSEFLNPDAVITIHGSLILDISGTTPGDPALIDASRLPEGSTIKVDIGSSPASGVYSLVSGMTEFNGVEIYRNGVYFKTLSALNKEDLTFSTMFSMTLTTSEEDPTLRLVLKQYLNYYPCVNTEWAGLDYGTFVVSPDGYTYTFGYDAFATYEEAEFVTLGSSPGMIMIYAENNCISPAGGINKTSSLRQGRIENTAVGISGSLTLGADTSAKDLIVDGKLIASSRNIMQNVVVNGTLEYSGESTGPQQDITVTESGTLTGWTTFAEDCGFTVDGYLQFSLGSYSGSSDDQNSVQYRNLYNLKGNTKYSVSIGSDTYSNQRYTLATGFAGSEDTSFVFVNPRGRYLGEIRLGKSAIVEKNVFTMTVEKDETTGEDCLMLTITQKGETLYLSSEWEGVEDGKEVQYPVMYGQIWGTAVMGESAFSDGDLAMEKAYGIDTIRICCGTFSFSEGITTQTLVSGSHTTGDVLIHDTEIAASLTITGADDTTALTGRNLTVWDCGSLSAGSGALLDSITVRSGGQVSVGGGAMLTGRCVFEDGSGIKLESNASLIFDITGMTAGGPAQYEGFGCVQWKQSATPLFTLAISGTQEYGDYLLANGVTGFTKSVSITVDGVQAGSVSTAEKTILNGTTYALKIQDGSLILRVAEYVQPSVVYLNSEWKKTPADTAVEVPGGTAVIGYDAFADMTKALSAAGSGGTVAITGGTFRFADGIDSDILLMNGAVHDSTVRKTLTVEAGASASNLVVSAGAALTVEAGAKLTGWGVFAEGAAITIDGTLDFDISAKMAGITYLYSGLSFVQGSTNFTLTVRDFQSLGLYALADGLTEFGSTITVVNTTGTQLGKLSVGTTTRIGGKAYRLMLNDGVLSVALLTPEEAVKCDVNGNGISDVLFQYTGGRNQTGYWLDGKDEWRSSNELHPVEWTLLGAYDMDGDGLADSVFVGNTVVNGVKGAYIGYYAGGVDADENWRNIDFLNNEAENVWENKIGNLTGNPGANSIVWHCAGLGAIGVWTDGTSNWISLGGGFDSNWTMVGCGDFDGDGRDSVVMSYLGGAKYYAIGINGSAVDMGSLNWAGWEVRAIGDFAGDGRDDMVLFHKELGALVMLADGNVDNYTAVGMLDAKDWFIVGAGDYDGDKQDDLLVRQYSTGMLGYYSSGDVARWNVLGYGVSMDWTVIA